MPGDTDLGEYRDLVKELLTSLSEVIVKPHTDNLEGGLFPNGVNDIDLKVSVGLAKIDLHISSAPANNAKPVHGDDPTFSLQNHVHPMALWNPNGFIVYVTVANSPGQNTTEVGQGTVKDVTVHGTPNVKIVVSNMDPIKNVYVYATVDSTTMNAIPVPGHGGFTDLEVP